MRACVCAYVCVCVRVCVCVSVCERKRDDVHEKEMLYSVDNEVLCWHLVTERGSERRPTNT